MDALAWCGSRASAQKSRDEECLGLPFEPAYMGLTFPHPDEHLHLPRIQSLLGLGRPKSSPKDSGDEQPAAPPSSFRYLGKNYLSDPPPEICLTLNFV